MKKLTLEERIAICEEYTQLWAKFFNFFGDGFEGRRVTGEAEAEFFRVMTELARKYFRLLYLLADDLKGAEKIPPILNASVSLNNIQAMTDTQLPKFQHDWHVVFIALNKALGRLLEHRPPPKPGKAPKANANAKQPLGAGSK